MKESPEQQEMEKVYLEMSPEAIPWNIEDPPEVLVRLVESGKILPCKAVDLGCGGGNYTIYLAGKGFNMTGIDFSAGALALAEKNAAKKGVRCTFVQADLTGELPDAFSGIYEFAYDWEVLHHIYPEKRMKYLRNVYDLLKPKAKYLSVCFSDKDISFGGTGKYRTTRIGTRLYFSDEEELKLLYSSLFHILELKTIEIIGKGVNHTVNFAFLEKNYPGSRI